MDAPDPLPSLGAVLARWALALAIAYVALLSSWLLPPVALDGPIALASWVVSGTGGKLGAPVVCLAGLALLLTRPGAPALSRKREAALLVGCLLACLGAMAWINEHVIKPGVGAPRPNLAALSASGALGSSPEAFYALGDKDARRARLREVLAEPHAGIPPLSPQVRAHWIEETGYSFPSGHSLASLTLASFFLAWGLTWTTGWRRVVCVALAPWAAAVCVSRTLLRVHTPLDVSAGAALGIAIGLAAYLASRWALARAAAAPPAAA